MATGEAGNGKKGRVAVAPAPAEAEKGATHQNLLPYKGGGVSRIGVVGRAAESHSRHLAKKTMRILATKNR
jgi:hypothetical protein